MRMPLHLFLDESLHKHDTPLYSCEGSAMVSIGRDGLFEPLIALIPVRARDMFL